MFGLFKSAPFIDDALGTFNKQWRYWVGTVDLSPHSNLELRLHGDRTSPDTSALSLARELPNWYTSQINQIETALYEYFLEYAEATAQGDLGELNEPLPQISDAKQIWPHVYPSYALIEPMQGIPTVEVAYRVGWDEEHTLGARLQNGCFIELCGSV
ncbi:hypothetical protein [Variovorax sp. PCZ-1]|uniref:DUF6985 domain-containing protein n=1 Tax=Variovorax sp. PCZ-1 TaxID=2835533 RepID=UPI001BCD5363|nr:hypothetical protein [Variovorax sp. PCZ-1]MBS7807578.1 hypothetical protein [Variovorax sp. PCZ-1]